MRLFIKKNMFGLLTLLISVIVLAFAIKINGGFIEFFGKLKNASLGWIAAAFCAIVVYWIVDGIALHLLIKTKYKDFSFRKSQLTAMTGFLYCNLTPFATGGQPAQIYQLKRFGVSVGDACSFITIKSIIYQIGLTIMSIIALILAGAYFISQIKYIGLLFVAGFLCNLVFIFVIMLVCFKVKFTKRICFAIISLLNKIKFGNKKLIKDKKRTIKNLLRNIEIFYASVAIIKKKPRLLLSCGGLTIVQLIAFYAVTYFVFKGFDAQPVVDPDFIYVLSLNSMQNMITQFVPIPGAAGAAEGSLALFLKILFPVPEALVFTGIVVWRFITYYFTIIVGSTVSLLNFSVGNKGTGVRQKVEE